LINKSVASPNALIDYLAPVHSLVLPFLSNSCLSIYPTAKLVLVCEKTIEMYFTAGSSWALVCAALKVPEVRKRERKK